MTDLIGQLKHLTFNQIFVDQFHAVDEWIFKLRWNAQNNRSTNIWNLLQIQPFDFSFWCWSLVISKYALLNKRVNWFQTKIKTFLIQKKHWRVFIRFSKFGHFKDEIIIILTKYWEIFKKIPVLVFIDLSSEVFLFPLIKKNMT